MILSIILLALALILPIATAIGSLAFGISFLAEYGLVVLSVLLIVGILLVLGKQKANENNNKTE